MFTDSYSIFSYLKAQHLKFPAEKGTYFHLAYLREALERGWVHSWNWVDTRDMIVDGMTKGRLDRTALQTLMAGRWQIKHEISSHSELVAQTTSVQFVGVGCEIEMPAPRRR